MRKDFKEAKRANVPKEVIADLAKQYHQCIILHSKLTDVRRKSGKKKNVSAIQKEYTRNFWKVSRKLLEESADSSDIQPNCSAEEAHSFFSTENSAQQHTFIRPP